MHRRFATLALCLLATLAAEAQYAQPQQPRVRKNIEDPGFDLEAYKLAVKILMDRDKDPQHKNDPVNWINNSYAYFAGLHNDFSDEDHGCVHGAEVFLPWHRELLYRFEMALRAAQPGRTDDVTIPYWVWTEKASGNEYPKAFEDESSVLFKDTRSTDPGMPLYPTDDIQKVIQDNDEWLAFAGGECTLKPNCVSGNCSICPSRDFGAFESPYHNKMHVALGSPMEDPEHAAEDPIFWSFHAYIDLIYQQWQCEHKKPPSCIDCNFRAMTDRRFKDVIDIERQLGYIYDIVPQCAVEVPQPVAGRATAAAPEMDVTASAAPSRKLKDAPRRTALSAPPPAPSRRRGVAPAPPPQNVFAVTIPEPAFEEAHLVLDGLTLPTEFSYSGTVYLYPADVKLDPNNADFATRHAAGDFSIWERAEGAGHVHDETARVAINVTHALRFLARTQRNASWRVAVVFGKPSSLDPGTTAEDAQRAIRVGSVELLLNRGASGF